MPTRIAVAAFLALHGSVHGFSTPALPGTGLALHGSEHGFSTPALPGTGLLRAGGACATTGPALLRCGPLPPNGARMSATGDHADDDGPADIGFSSYLQDAPKRLLSHLREGTLDDAGRALTKKFIIELEQQQNFPYDVDFFNWAVGGTWDLLYSSSRLGIPDPNLRVRDIAVLSTSLRFSCASTLPTCCTLPPSVCSLSYFYSPLLPASAPIPLALVLFPVHLHSSALLDSLPPCACSRTPSSILVTRAVRLRSAPHALICWKRIKRGESEQTRGGRDQSREKRLV
jgi:hypothetical protein